MLPNFQAPSPFLLPTLALLVGSLFTGSSLGAQNPSKDAWKAPSRAKRKKNPLSSTADVIEAGKALYLSACMVCHGTQGKGDGPAAAALNPRPKNLTDPAILKMTDGELFWKIRTGKAPMPAFGTSLKKEQIWKIIVFVRNLEHKSAPRSPIQVSDPQAATHRILGSYLDLLGALKSKNWNPTSRAKATAFLKTIENLRITKTLSKKEKAVWLEAKARMKKGAALLASAKNKNFIEGFQQVTRGLNSLMEHFGNPEKQEVTLLVCKMGPSKEGNLWLQVGGKTIRNPFPWGKKMPTCGEILKTYPSSKTARKSRTTK